MNFRQLSWFVAMSAFTSFFIQTDGSAVTVVMAPTPVSSEDAIVFRTSGIWIDGIPMALEPAPEQVDDFDYVLADMVSTMGSSDDGAVPITNAVARERIREAQALIEAQRELPGAWRWEDVRAAVRRVGTSMPVLEDTQRIADLSMSYELRTDAIRVQGSWIEDHTSEEVARNLVHEITHAVYRDEVMRITSYTADEWAALSVYCLDIYRAQSIATEGLAHLNEARWAHVRGTPIDHPIKREILDSAEEARSGTPRGYNRLAGNLLVYANFSLQSFNARPDIPVCGPPIIVRGERRGEFFLPWELNRELLEPVFLEISAYYTDHSFEDLNLE